MNRYLRKAKELSRQPEFWLKFAAYAIPLAFLLYVLYWNFLPFGYSKTFTIDVGAEGDTNTSSEFYLEPSRDLSERKVSEDGTTYRELNGMAYAVFKPKAVLKNAEITVEIEGDDVSIIPPVIDFDSESIEWDYSWDFTQGKTPAELGLVGNAFPFDGCMYFDGKSRLELPNSTDKFEDGPFSVYIELNPKDRKQDNQQIIGHYNWELTQNSDSIIYSIRATDGTSSKIYRVTYLTDPEFFSLSHSILITYHPSIRSGYIEMFIDEILIGRTYVNNNVISSSYGQRNLSIGKNDFSGGNYLDGCLLVVNITNKNVNEHRNYFHLINTLPYNFLELPLISNSTSSLMNIKVKVNK